MLLGRMPARFTVLFVVGELKLTFHILFSPAQRRGYNTGRSLVGFNHYLLKRYVRHCVLLLLREIMQIRKGITWLSCHVVSLYFLAALNTH